MSDDIAANADAGGTERPPLDRAKVEKALRNGDVATLEPILTVIEAHWLAQAREFLGHKAPYANELARRKVQLITLSVKERMGMLPNRAARRRAKRVLSIEDS